MAAGLSAGKDFFVFSNKSYTWSTRLNLDNYSGNKLFLRGAGGAITTVNSDGFGYFEGGAGGTILVVGIQFQGIRARDPNATPETEPLCRFVDFGPFKAYNSRSRPSRDGGSGSAWTRPRTSSSPCTSRSGT